MTKPNITVVVPVYGDWESLGQCIDSLKQYVSPKQAKILFVNDCGPEVEMLEKNIKASIEGHKHMEYYRNTENLGFVKTCNRAVYELDKSNNDVLLLNSDTIVTEGFLEELQSVLYISEKHGTVCARSNNATIATVPFMNLDNTDDRNLEHSKAVYDAVKDRLPRFTVVPVVIGFCMLIKRNLIHDYGLFDEAYRLGYGEECDFCQRINKYGYSSVLANHAYVYHLESRSFASEKKARLMQLNEKVLHSRYPYYEELVQRYIRDYMDPIDWFADAIAGGHDNKKVLINLLHLPPVYNGTSRNVITFLDYITQNKSLVKGIDFTIVANESSIRFFDLKKYGIPVKLQKDIDEIYHLCYCPSQIFHLDQLLFMNRYCYKIVFSMLDIITIRSNKLLASDFMQRTVFADSMHAADAVITISEATKQDTIDYFGAEIKEDIDKFTVIYQGFNDKTLFDSDNTKKFPPELEAVVVSGEYHLIQGNAFDFKRIKESINILKSVSKETFIVLGYSGVSKVKEKNIFTLAPGVVSDAQLRRLQKNACTIIAPSIYEGFGLFVADAIAINKPVVVSEMMVNEELKKLYSNTKLIVSFNELSELPKAISTASSIHTEPLDIPMRSIDDYNKETLETIKRVLDVPLNEKHLRERWEYFTKMTTYLLSKNASVSARKSTVHIIADLLRTNTPGLYTVSKRYYRKYIKRT